MESSNLNKMLNKLPPLETLEELEKFWEMFWIGMWNEIRGFVLQDEASYGR